MFRWFGQRFGKSQQKAVPLPERELGDDIVIQDNTQQRVPSDSLRALLKTAIADAEQIATNIKIRAQTEAEAEAARIITQAQLEVQEIKGSSEIAAQKQAEDIISMANRKAEITEVEARQKALLFLLRAREDIEKEIGDEYKRAHSRLSSSLQNLMSEGQNIEAELKSKRIQEWESKTFELKQYEAGLLSASEAVAAPSEISAPTEVEIELDIASQEKPEEPVQLQEETLEEKTEEPAQLREETLEEKTEEPVQLQEEASEEKTEEPVQLREEASEEKIEEPVQLREEAPEEKIEEPVQLREETLEEKTEEPVQLQEEASEEKTEEPVQLQEEAPEEKIEEPVQLQEEALEEKTEEPVQLQEEAIVSEPIGKATEELLEQHFPEERPGKGEDESAPVELDSQAPYAGEVEVEIATPVDPKMVYKLYDHLQTLPELRILHTRGSWDRGTVIAVVLDKPIPLVSLLSEMAGVKVTQALPQKDSLVEGISSSLLGTRRKGTTRIKLTLKEAQSP